MTTRELRVSALGCRSPSSPPSRAAAQAPAAAPPTAPRRSTSRTSRRTRASSSGSGSLPDRGPLAMLSGARVQRKGRRRAPARSRARSPTSSRPRATPSQRISRDAPLPTGEGWLVTGIFYAIDAQTGMIKMPSFVSGQPDPVNTQITVSVADLAVEPHRRRSSCSGRPRRSAARDRPSAGTLTSSRRSSSSNQVESAADIKKLAKEIVDTILKNKAIVVEKARAQTP